MHGTRHYDLGVKDIDWRPAKKYNESAAGHLNIKIINGNSIGVNWSLAAKNLDLNSWSRKLKAGHRNSQARDWQSEDRNESLPARIQQQNQRVERPCLKIKQQCGNAQWSFD